jgi:hypothetical protein
VNGLTDDTKGTNNTSVHHDGYTIAKNSCLLGTWNREREGPLRRRKKKNANNPMLRTQKRSNDD